MFLRTCLLALSIGALAACASSSEDREWMKINEKYTGEDFRRDVAACSKAGKLDDGCMRARGWVDVANQKIEKAPESTKPSYTPPPSR